MSAVDTAVTPFPIDVVSDVVCPWCFIGKHNLDAALAKLRDERPQLAPRVQWRPFFLNPDTPPEGEPYRAFLEKKFGGAAAVDRMQARLAEAGRAAGVEFAFDKMKVRPNTLHAHRLLHHVQLRKDASPLKERLMRGHFQLGENVGDVETLVGIAVECGEDEVRTREYLRSGADADVVREGAAHAAKMGVGGVPFFIFNQKVALSGAHPPQDILLAVGQAIETPASS
jgi:predicted DsbA family dithiol-disulfide isomerase